MHWLAELDGRRIVVEVPGSSANLGAGYDCLAVCARADQPGRARGARLKSRRDRAGGRGRRVRVSCRRITATASCEASEAALSGRAGARSASPSVADRDAQRSAAGARARLERGGDGRRLIAGNALVGEPLTARDLLRLATEIEGHSRQCRRPRCGADSWSLARASTESRTIRFRCSTRPARGAVHPGAAAGDEGDAGRPPGQGPAGGRRRQPGSGCHRRGGHRHRPLRPAAPR